MSDYEARIYTTPGTFPPGLLTDDFFHSTQLFMLCRNTPRQKPYLVTAEAPDGRVVAQLLAVVRYRTSWFPPYLYRHCRVLGEGVYADDGQKAVLFGLMLRALTERLGRWTLYIEFSNLSQKMMGYSQFRDCGYFPVRWMSIHNSLHSRTPEERLSEQMLRRIRQAYQRGVVTDEVQGEADFRSFMKLLRHHNWTKPKRYIPADDFFRGLQHSTAQPPSGGGPNGRLFLTRYRGRVVGCSAVAYSQRQAYLWYAAYRRKSFAWLRPDVLTIWHAIKSSYEQGYEHIYFMDVGLPFQKNAFRDFILRFGGKPTSTYRWFRCSIGWLNRLFSWFYRD